MKNINYKSLNVYFSPVLCYYFSQEHVSSPAHSSHINSMCSSLRVTDQVSHPDTTGVICRSEPGFRQATGRKKQIFHDFNLLLI